MEEELISKKEVLERTGISYGQFYRWKRKGLIPESWFIRKSTFTGQEAFLPKDKILERIERIKQLKEEHSLDEIAELLSPEVVKKGFTREELLRLDWCPEDLLNYYDELREKKGPYSFNEVLYLAALERLRRRDLSQEEIELALATLLRGERELPEGERALIVARKPLEGSLIIARKKPHISYCLICPDHCVLDPQTEVVVRLELGQLLEEVKLKMRGEI
jgi:DNA-binding transcriptional MerR regulator